MAALALDSDTLYAYFPIIPSKFVGLLFGSFLIGLITAILASIILKSNNLSKNQQVGIMFLVPWGTYFMAEFLDFSGIVTIVSNGFAMASYALPNLSTSASKTTVMLYEGIASNFDIIVFFYLGVALFSIENHFS